MKLILLLVLEVNNYPIKNQDNAQKKVEVIIILKLKGDITSPTQEYQKK